MIQSYDIGAGPFGSVVIRGSMAPATQANVQAAAAASGLVAYLFNAPFTIMSAGQVLTFRQNEAIPLSTAQVAAFRAAGANMSILGSAPTAVAVLPPLGFAARWTPASTNPNLTFLLSSGVYSTAFNITSLLPGSFTSTYYFDPVNGSDTAGNGSSGTPYKTLGKITGLAVAGTAGSSIQAIPILSGDAILRASQGYNNAVCVADLYIVNQTGYRLICGGSASTAPTAWTNTSTGVFQASMTGTANATGVIDTLAANRLAPINPLNGLAVPNVPSAFRVANKVASKAAVTPNSNTFWVDTTNLIIYYAPVDGRDLTNTTNAAGIILANSTNVGRGSAGNANVYVQGVDFVGGSTPFLALATSATVSGFVAFNTCSFQGSTGAANGLSVQGTKQIYNVNCGAYFNYADGFNEHSFTSAGSGGSTTDSPNWINIGCCAWGNGTTGAAPASNNATTSHDYCNGICVNCVDVNSNDRVFVHTDSAMVWSMGHVAGGAVNVNTGGGYETYSALINATLWLDGCVAVHNTANPDFSADATTASIYDRNMTVQNVSAQSTGPIAVY